MTLTVACYRVRRGKLFSSLNRWYTCLLLLIGMLATCTAVRNETSSVDPLWEQNEQREQDLWEQDLEALALVKPHFVEIQTQLRAELNVLLELIKIHCRKREFILEDKLVTLFSKDHNSGGVLDPGAGQREALLHELTVNGNCREIANVITQFIHQQGQAVLWDILMEPDVGGYFAEQLPPAVGWLNTEKLAHVRRTLRDVIGWDFRGPRADITWDDVVSHRFGSEFPAILHHGVPVLLEATNNMITADYVNTWKGSFANSVRPVDNMNSNEREVSTRSMATMPLYKREIHEPLSHRELAWIKNPPETASFKNLPREGATPPGSLMPKWKLGRWFFKPRPLNVFAQEMRHKYNKLNSAQMSGHAYKELYLMDYWIPARNQDSTTWRARFARNTLGMALWMAPYHHSVHEVYEGARTNRFYNPILGLHRESVVDYDYHDDIKTATQKMLANAALQDHKLDKVEHVLGHMLPNKLPFEPVRSRAVLVGA